MRKHDERVRQGRWKEASQAGKRRRSGRTLDSQREIWLRGIC
jgi:hypothetical protein